jgi:dephospho-CoA kinase
MFIIGLTGSIGMGKSATAQMFRDEGMPVHDADATVHALYSGKAAPLIEAAFPGTARDGTVDREALAKAVLGQDAAMKKLESIVHPLVREAEQQFAAHAAAAGHKALIVDVPLLFETGGNKRCNLIVTVSAPKDVQKARVLARPGMTEEKFTAILARQTPDEIKRLKSHYIIDTSKGFDVARAQVRAVLRALKTLSR